MHEDWLQKYIREHYRQFGFERLYGPFKVGADFKGIYYGKRVKVEAEWDYSDYISHRHEPGFADVLVVATFDPVPERLKVKLPALIINLDREQVVEWAKPRIVNKDNEDYYSYSWRRFSRNLLYMYTWYRKHNRLGTDFLGYELVLKMYKNQKPAGFEFGAGGKEKSFEGSPEDKAAWDYWLNLAHAVAGHFRLKPALLRPTWIDRIALYLNHTGRITGPERKRFQDIAIFIDDLILTREP